MAAGPAGRSHSAAMSEDHISLRLDAVLADLPEDAWSISHDPDSDYRVCTIVIDWRRVPDEEGSKLLKKGKLRLVGDTATGTNRPTED